MSRSRYVLIDLVAPALAALALAACSDDLAPAATPDASPTAPPPPVPSKVVTTDNGDGSFTTRVDATAMDAWTGFDFQSRGEMAETDARWDLAFRRFEIKLDGGTSGAGGVQIAALAEADFAEITEAPAEGWTTDAEAALAFSAGDAWYAYDAATHVLTPRPIVYVVRSAEGDHFKLAFEDYYDDAGTSGFPAFRWAPVAAPSEPPPVDETREIDASVAGTWTYVNLAGDASDASWDIAFSRTLVRTNSGTSGSGQGGARLAPEGVAFDAITAAPAQGYEVDAELPVPGPPGSGVYSGNPVLGNWFDYDPVTHAVSPKPVVFLVRTADGAYAKLQILTWASGRYTLRLAAVPVEGGAP